MGLGSIPTHPSSAEAYGKSDFQVDFGRLPKVLAEEVSKQLGEVETNIVRTYLFGSYASNYDLRDDDAVQRRLRFLLHAQRRISL